MIERFIKALLSRDCNEVAALFSEKCRYFDYCPIGFDAANYHIYGRESIEMVFLNKFFFNTFEISDPVIDDERHANYVVRYMNSWMHAAVTVEKLDEDGLIQELTVRPA